MANQSSFLTQGHFLPRYEHLNATFFHVCFFKPLPITVSQPRMCSHILWLSFKTLKSDVLLLTLFWYHKSAPATTEVFISWGQYKTSNLNRQTEEPQEDFGPPQTALYPIPLQNQLMAIFGEKKKTQQERLLLTCSILKEMSHPCHLWVRKYR